MARLTVSETGLSLIAAFEGFRADSLPLGDGRWTVGFGSSHTAEGAVSVTEAEAKALLKRDLEPIADLLNDTSFSPLNQNQFDALSSLAFNIGISAFKSSDVLEFIRRGEPIAAAMAMDNWCTANLESRPIVVDVLVRRRAAEKALFLALPTGAVAAPSPLLVPVSKIASATPVPIWDWSGETPAPADETATPNISDVAPDNGPAVDEVPGVEPIAPTDVSPQEQAAASLTRRLDVLVGPEVAGEEPIAAPTTDVDTTSAHAVEPEQTTEIVHVETAIEVDAPVAAEGAASGLVATEIAAPFPITEGVVIADAPAEPVQSFTETVLPAQDNSAPIEAIAPDNAAQADAPIATNSAEIVQPATPLADAAIPPASMPIADATQPEKPQNFLVQGLIVLGGVLLLLWSYATGGFQPVAPGAPVSQNVSLLYAIAGACLIGVGGYFLLRPPRES
jgi:lysozyme